MEATPAPAACWHPQRLSKLLGRALVRSHLRAILFVPLAHRLGQARIQRAVCFQSSCGPHLYLTQPVIDPTGQLICMQWFHGLFEGNGTDCGLLGPSASPVRQHKLSAARKPGKDCEVPRYCGDGSCVSTILRAFLDPKDGQLICPAVLHGSKQGWLVSFIES